MKLILVVVLAVVVFAVATACDPAFTAQLENDLSFDVTVYSDPPTASKNVAFGRSVKLWAVDESELSNTYRLKNRNTGEELGCLFASFTGLKSNATVHVKASEAKPCP